MLGVVCNHVYCSKACPCFKQLYSQWYLYNVLAFLKPVIYFRMLLLKSDILKNNKVFSDGAYLSHPFLFSRDTVCLPFGVISLPLSLQLTPFSFLPSVALYSLLLSSPEKRAAGQQGWHQLQEAILSSKWRCSTEEKRGTGRTQVVTKKLVNLV